MCVVCLCVYISVYLSQLHMCMAVIVFLLLASEDFLSFAVFTLQRVGFICLIFITCMIEGMITNIFKTIKNHMECSFIEGLIVLWKISMLLAQVWSYDDYRSQEEGTLPEPKSLLCHAKGVTTSTIFSHGHYWLLVKSILFKKPVCNPNKGGISRTWIVHPFEKHLCKPNNIALN